MFLPTWIPFPTLYRYAHPSLRKYPEPACAVVHPLTAESVAIVVYEFALSMLFRLNPVANELVTIRVDKGTLSMHLVILPVTFIALAVFVAGCGEGTRKITPVARQMLTIRNTNIRMWIFFGLRRFL